MDWGTKVEGNDGTLGRKLTTVATVVGGQSDIISEHQPTQNNLHVDVTNGLVQSIALEASVRKAAPNYSYL